MGLYHKRSFDEDDDDDDDDDDESDEKVNLSNNLISRLFTIFLCISGLIFEEGIWKEEKKE